MQADGNLVIYTPAGTAIWSTNTWDPTCPVAQGDRILPGQVLKPGLTAASRSSTRATVTSSFYHNHNGVGALWATGTNGRGTGVCIMQADGNLVIYTPGGNAIWASGTSGSPKSYLVAQSDGNVVVYNSAGTAIWATNTWVPTGPVAQGARARF